MSRPADAACYAHVRRYLFEAIKTAPVAQEAVDIIGQLYEVDRTAQKEGLSLEAHLALRRKRAGSI